VIWTKETFYICRDPKMVDKIPLHEVLCVTEMKDEIEGLRPTSNRAIFSSGFGESRSKSDVHPEKPGDGFAQKQKTFSIQGNLSNILQIKTIADGFNSGRTYYFSTREGTNPELSRQKIIAKLSENVVKAQRKAEAKSRFQKSQEPIQRLQKSMLFQTAVAVLIMMVNHNFCDNEFCHFQLRTRLLHTSTRPAFTAAHPAPSSSSDGVHIIRKRPHSSC
jgi:hypothetical protein